MRCREKCDGGQHATVIGFEDGDVTCDAVFNDTSGVGDEVIAGEDDEVVRVLDPTVDWNGVISSEVKCSVSGLGELLAGGE